MPGRPPSFTIADAAPFDANLESFFRALEATDAALTIRLKRELPRLLNHSDVNGAANVNPYFIGVFDTVAALGSYLFSGALIVLAAAVLAVFSYLQSLFLLSFLPTFLWSVGIAFVIGVIWYAVTHVQYAVGLPGYSFFRLFVEKGG